MHYVLSNFEEQLNVSTIPRIISYMSTKKTANENRPITVDIPYTKGTNFG